MEERRKIVIPTGVDPEETLSRHYFDTEATLAARPVVPLTDADAAQAAPVVKPTSGRRWLLPAVIAGAVALGLVTGLGISVYRYRQPQQTESPVAVRPIADKTRGNTLPWTYTPEEPLDEEDATATVADANEVTTPDDSKRETQPRAVNESDKKKSREDSAREAREDKEDQIAQQREERDDDRAQRQEERRRRRARDERNNEDLPQDPIIRHTREGVHRIREIFEGTP